MFQKEIQRLTNNQQRLNKLAKERLFRKINPIQKQINTNMFQKESITLKITLLKLKIT